MILITYKTMEYLLTNSPDRPSTWTLWASVCGCRGGGCGSRSQLDIFLYEIHVPVLEGVSWLFESKKFQEEGSGFTRAV